MSRLDNPKIQEAWKRFIDEIKEPYGPEPLDPEDLAALKAIDELVWPIVRYGDDGVIMDPGVWTPAP